MKISQWARENFRSYRKNFFRFKWDAWELARTKRIVHYKHIQHLTLLIEDISNVRDSILS